MNNLMSKSEKNATECDKPKQFKLKYQTGKKSCVAFMK